MNTPTPVSPGRAAELADDARRYGACHTLWKEHQAWCDEAVAYLRSIATALSCTPEEAVKQIVALREQADHEEAGAPAGIVPWTATVMRDGANLLEAQSLALAEQKAEVERLTALKTPASTKLVNLSKAMWEDSERERKAAEASKARLRAICEALELGKKAAIEVMKLERDEATRLRTALHEAYLELDILGIRTIGTVAAVLPKMKAALTATASGAALECQHEWVDARNEFVQSGELCLKCHAVRAGAGTGQRKEKME